MNDISELLNAIEQPDQFSDIPISNNSITEFLRRFNIKSGLRKITARNLYEAYRLTTKEPETHNSFVNILTKIINTKSTSNINYFMINEDTTLNDIFFKNEVKEKPMSAWLLNNFEKFLSDCEITPGDYWIHQHILIYIWKKYLKYKKKNATISQEALKRFFELHFEYRITKYGKCFKISSIKHLISKKEYEYLTGSVKSEEKIISSEFM